MPVKEKEVKILQEAFKQFNLTSSELEQSYRVLKEELYQLKKQLKESQREKEHLREEAERNHRLAAVGEMAARMAHELRNPLGSIELFASLLQKEITQISSDPEKVEWTKHLIAAVRTMDYTITNLLFFTCKPTPEFRTTDLKKVLTETLTFATHLLQQSRIDVRLKTDRLMKPVCCDEDLLRQVLLNLIINAVDAMPKGGCLEIDAFTEDGERKEAVLSISDTGTGILEEHLTRIFDPFYTTKKKGSGLGLAISQNAIAAHKGFIRVEKKPELGTRFIIHLPLEQGES